MLVTFTFSNLIHYQDSEYIFYCLNFFEYLNNNKNRILRASFKMDYIHLKFHFTIYLVV
jgi:hypothetical protein